MVDAKPRDELVALSSFLASAFLAGGNAIAMRVSNRELEPYWGAALRFGLSAAVLALIMVAMRLSLPRGRALVGAVLFGALAFGGSMGLAYLALVEIQAGLATTVLALIPLATLLLSAMQGQDKVTGAALLGSLIVAIGIGGLMYSRSAIGEAPPFWSMVALLGGVLAFAQASVVVRQFPRVHPVTTNAVAMSAGAVILLIISLVSGEEQFVPREADTWKALAYVVPVGSVIVFVLYMITLKYWTPSRAAYEFVLIPIFTMALSIWIDDESVTAAVGASCAIVLLGVYIGVLRPARQAELEDAPADAKQA